MSVKTAQWLIYTCLIGLIPVIARLIIWAVSIEETQLFVASDLIVFGIVLNSSNINEVQHLRDNDKVWKTFQNGFSSIFLIVYALLFFTTVSVGPDYDQSTVLIITLILNVISFLMGLVVVMRITASESGGRHA